MDVHSDGQYTGYRLATWGISMIGLVTYVHYLHSGGRMYIHTYSCNNHYTTMLFIVESQNRCSQEVFYTMAPTKRQTA